MNLISDEYRTEQTKMHRTYPGYGVACLEHAELIAHMINARKITSLLDYGAGKGRLVDALSRHLRRGGEDLHVHLYEPAIAELAADPEPAELAVCIDVLEHVEPELTENVVAHLAGKATKIAFITIGMTPAAKVLSDGRNAHINLRPANEWVDILNQHFNLEAFRWDKRRSSIIYVGTKK